jgi:glucose-6-phosphate isomerase
VELGKQLAKALAPAVGGDGQAIDAEDSSTAGLIRYYREHRTV